MREATGHCLYWHRLTARTLQVDEDGSQHCLLCIWVGLDRGTAVRAPKSARCVNGHLWAGLAGGRSTLINAMYKKNGYRHCRECRRLKRNYDYQIKSARAHPISAVIR